MKKIVITFKLSNLLSLFQVLESYVNKMGYNFQSMGF